MEIRPEERLDDLQYHGLVLIQRPDLYCFTSDAVLLANSVRAGVKDRVADLGCGSGIISVLLAYKRGCRVTGVEIQPVMAELARRNAEFNNLSDKIEVYEGDMRGCVGTLGAGSFDTVVCNPPYYKKGSGETRLNESQLLSRHESACNLSDIACTAAKLLRCGGALYMIHKSERMAEVLTALSVQGLEPKEVILIYPKRDKQADTFIVRAVKGGKAGMKLDSLIVYDDQGKMSERAQKLYGKE